MALAYDYVGDNNQQLFEALNQLVNEYKSQAWVELNQYFAGNAIMINLFEEMFNLQMIYDEQTKSQAICWDRVTGMVFEIENNFSQTDPRFDEATYECVHETPASSGTPGRSRATVERARKLHPWREERSDQCHI